MRKLLLPLLALLPLTAAAHGSRTEYARVIDVEPVYQKYSYRQQANCYVGHGDAGATIAGAVIGAAIGHEISGHKGGSVAGAVIGGSLGHELSRDGVCRQDKRYRRPVLTGYNVTYRYHGDLYTRFMPEHPGRHVQIEHRRHKRFANAH
ncbi:glycine zipper 2TM domain-containing protein [Bowmanella sp. JS7-9]|uniref:Glycine zipper 2TM domain-containing protein n=1 Tax=Pseudobowmanella zhangzhouensis TaxID=1537679 RepID=A0ABW1XKQ8_9ALTE|nr:hypothetical protein [Bowmanella sp. JS7-9]TBX22474.1 hypothetical protein TK45_08410 [Bowmanella sp. JS7-9]